MNGVDIVGDMSVWVYGLCVYDYVCVGVWGYSVGTGMVCVGVCSGNMCRVGLWLYMKFWLRGWYRCVSVWVAWVYVGGMGARVCGVGVWVLCMCGCVVCVWMVWFLCGCVGGVGVWDLWMNVCGCCV